MNSEQVSFKSSSKTGQRLCENNVSLTVLRRTAIRWEEQGEGKGFVLHPAIQDAVPLPWIEES